MGSCLTKCHQDQQEEIRPDNRYTSEEGADNSITDHFPDSEFDEDFRSKSRHRAADGGGDRGQGWRRKSSGLSRFSQDGRHVIHPPFTVGAFNIQK